MNYRIIAPTSLAIFSFFLYPPCQVEVEPDPAKLISDNWGSDAEDIDI